jgi:hypothetical protein
LDIHFPLNRGLPVSEQPENNVHSTKEIDQLNSQLEVDETDELMFELAEGLALQEVIGDQVDQDDELSFSDEILEGSAENSNSEKIYGLPIPEIEELLKLQQSAQARAYKIVKHLRAAEDRILEVKRDRRAAINEFKDVQQKYVQLQNELAAVQAREKRLEFAERQAQERIASIEKLAAEAKQKEEFAKQKFAEREKNWSIKLQEMQVIADEKNSLLSLTSNQEKKIAEQAESLAKHAENLAKQSESLAKQSELLEVSRRKLLEYQRNRDELAASREKIQQQNQELERLRAANEALVNESKELTSRVERGREERDELLKLMRTAMERLERRRGDSQIMKKPTAGN